MHIPITVSNKTKIPKGTRIIKQKLTKKLTQKVKKKLPITRLGSPIGWKVKGHRMGGRRIVTGWVEGEGLSEASLMVRRTEASRTASELKRRERPTS